MCSSTASQSFQAMVIALCTKLGGGQTRSSRDDTIGGSTFGFEVWPGHPEFEAALSFLSRLRAQGSELRQRVADYNAAHTAPLDSVQRVVTYVGQTVISDDSGRTTWKTKDDSGLQSSP